MSHKSSTLMYVPQFIRSLFVREVATVTSLDKPLIYEIQRAAQIFRSSLTPQMLATFNGRLDRGLELALNGAVHLDPTPSQPHRCRVTSSDGSRSYLVDIDAKICECIDSQKSHHCKHRIAAFYYIQARNALAVQAPKLQARSNSSHSNEELLKMLGFDAEPHNLAVTSVIQPAIRLGYLYRRYLHGEELDQKPCKVTITNITRETVTPHPSQSSYEKWCLWVSGLPLGMPCGILFGQQGDKDLVSIFGRVDIQSLKGKSLVIYPQTMIVAGTPRIAIRFRGAL
jgi:hypothetical protein